MNEGGWKKWSAIECGTTIHVNSDKQLFRIQEEDF